MQSLTSEIIGITLFVEASERSRQAEEIDLENNKNREGYDKQARRI